MKKSDTTINYHAAPFHNQERIYMSAGEDSGLTEGGTEGVENDIGGEDVAAEDNTPPQPETIEDRPLPIPQSLSDVGAGFLWDEILVAIIVVAGAIAGYFVIRYFLNKAADSLHLDRGQLKGVYSVAKLGLIVITITIIIFQFSSVSGVAAGAISVAAGTIIGFSSRNTISNAIAGILLLSARPFVIGDRIRASISDELIGDVIEITILYTKLKTIRNELVAIPNQLLLQQQIINYSGLDLLACSIEVALTYGHSRKRIEGLLLEAARKTNDVIAEPEPMVLLKRLDSYGAAFELRAYTNKPNEFFKIQSELRKNVYDLFQMHGIDLTVPQAQANMDMSGKQPGFGFDKESLT